MPLVYPNAQLVKALEIFVNKEQPEDLTLHLYQNDFTPEPGVFDIAQVTEADFTGYSSEALTPANWSASGATTAVLTHTAVEFESTAGGQNQNVYGYYITGNTSGDLKYAERFSDGPYNIVSEGDKITVTPRISGSNVTA